MTRRAKTGCIGCGGPCTVDCVDNHGNAYKGCPRCRFKSAEEIAAMSALSPPKPRDYGAAWERLRNNVAMFHVRSWPHLDDAERDAFAAWLDAEARRG